MYVIKVHEYSVCNKHYYFSVCDKHYFYYFYRPLLRVCTSMRAQRPNTSVRAHLPTHNSLSLALSLSHTQPPPNHPLYFSLYTRTKPTPEDYGAGKYNKYLCAPGKAAVAGMQALFEAQVLFCFSIPSISARREKLLLVVSLISHILFACSLSLSLTRARALSLSLSLSFSRALSLSRALSRSLSRALSLSLSLSLSCSPSGDEHDL